MTTMPRLLHGMEPDKLSTNVLNINGDGYWADAAGTDFFIYQQSLQGLLQVDLTRLGLNGRDAGTLPNSVGDWYIYLLGDPGNTQSTAAVASRSITYGGVDLSNIPSNLTRMRKLPFGFIYNPAWDGIPNFHIPVSGSFFTYTDSEYAAPWIALANGTAQSWTDVDLSNYIPDNARVAYIKTEVRDGGINAGGSGYLRSYQGQTTGVIAGSSTPAMSSSFSNHFIRVDSLRKLQYKVTGGSSLFITVLGYHMTEPS